MHMFRITYDYYPKLPFKITKNFWLSCSFPSRPNENSGKEHERPQSMYFSFGYLMVEYFCNDEESQKMSTLPISSISYSNLNFVLYNLLNFFLCRINEYEPVQV